MSGGHDSAKPQLAMPIPPTDEECCGNGCERCVWVVYREACDLYRLQQLEAQLAGDEHGSN